jgi:hypothetical protein
MTFGSALLARICDRGYKNLQVSHVFKEMLVMATQAWERVPEEIKPELQPFQVLFLLDYSMILMEQLGESVPDFAKKFDQQLYVYFKNVKDTDLEQVMTLEAMSWYWYTTLAEQETAADFIYLLLHVINIELNTSHLKDIIEEPEDIPKEVERILVEVSFYVKNKRPILAQTLLEIDVDVQPDLPALFEIRAKNCTLGQAIRDAWGN